MRRSIQLFGGLLSFCVHFSAWGQELFVESYWQNNIPGSSDSPSASVAIWAGGNESSISDAPRSSNGIFLAESAVGQTTPQSLGYPAAAIDLASSAAWARTAGQLYRYDTNLLGGILATNPAITWNIVFPGGFNPVNGTIYVNPASDSINYKTNLLNQADYDLRARLRVNPCDSDAAQQLVLLQEDRMLPLEWCGTEAIAYATKARLIQFPPVNGTNAEVLAIEQARGFYRSACNILSQFLSNPSDAALAEGLNPCLSANVTNQVSQVFDAYLRNLAEYAHASLGEFQVRSMLQFYDPSQQQSTLPSATQSLLNDIDQTLNDIQIRLLLAAPFQNLPFYTQSGAGQIQSILLQMSRMHESILLGRITFVAGASGDNADPSLFYGEYTSSFIPFFNSQLTQNGNVSSFNLALTMAQNFAAYAAPMESGASNAVVGATQLAYNYKTSQNDLQNQYFNQLVALCGYGSEDTNNDPLPDIFFAALPPGTRESAAAQAVPGFQLTQQGTIYQQWLSLESAETRLDDATLQLSNIFTTMLVKQQVASAIYSNYVNYAALILTNGQQIAVFDIQKGEIQAQEALVIAQINHDTAEKQANNDMWGGVISAAGTFAAAYFTGGGSLLAWNAMAGAEGGISSLSSIGGTFSAVENAYDQASAALAIGQVQANTARQLAAIDAQIQRIVSAEQAQAQYLNADVTMLNLSADLNALRLQAESQKIQIQLAAQSVDQERNKLATLFGQVSYLLRQYGRSVNLLAQNPALSDSFLLSRNHSIQQADDAFLLAQQWAFLTAQCFYYEDNCLADLSSKTYLQNILAARNVATLVANLNAITSSNAVLGATCQGSISYGYKDISLRNNVIQQNSVSNGVVTIYEPTILSGVVGTNAAASTASWTNFLSQNISTSLGFRRLRVHFSTSVNPQIQNGLPRNPLFNPFTFGAVISPSSAPGGTCNGIQVNFVTSNLQLAPGGVSVLLAQGGTSLIRSLGYCNPNNSFRCFNFDPFQNSFTASFNGFDPSLPGSSAFKDRSIANDLWALTLVDDGGNGTTILNNLDKLVDIQLRFGMRNYTDQNCGN